MKKRSAKVIQEEAGWRVECRENNVLLNTLYFHDCSQVLAVSRAEVWVVAGIAIPVSYGLEKEDLGLLNEKD
jgi:hypothetical protein